MKKIWIISIVLLVTVVVLAIVVIAITYFPENKKNNETNQNNNSLITYECLNDSDCYFDQLCKNYTCEEIKCGYCSYMGEHKCIRFECCKDNDCAYDWRCRTDFNSCEPLNCNETEEYFNHTCRSCGNCQYIQNHKCFNFECCANEECAPGYFCGNHSCTKLECGNDSDCLGDNITIGFGGSNPISHIITTNFGNYTIELKGTTFGEGSESVYLSINDGEIFRLFKGNSTNYGPLIIYAKEAKWVKMWEEATLELIQKKCFNGRCLNISSIS